MKNRKIWKKSSAAALTLLLLLQGLLLAGCGDGQLAELAGMLPDSSASPVAAESVEDVPEYEGEPYAVVNDNVPEFETEGLEAEAYEAYSRLDGLGRCQTAEAVVGQELMPQEERGSIGQVKPSGWHTVRYENVEGKYLYNRCHLIGYQLTGENANERNLITGTRYMNTEGMLPFEDMVADYVQETGNHVMYRVVPVYQKQNLVASGVQMEAWSIEDEGEGICFNVYVYNAQPGIEIDYTDGDSRLDGTGETESAQSEDDGEVHDYILNTSSKKFHKPSCSGVQDMAEENMDTFRGSREDIMEQGYDPCGRCKP